MSPSGPMEEQEKAEREKAEHEQDEAEEEQNQEASPSIANGEEGLESWEDLDSWEDLEQGDDTEVMWCMLVCAGCMMCVCGVGDGPSSHRNSTEEP